MPQRLAHSGGLVFVEDHMFSLVDPGAPAGVAPGADPPAALGPLLTVGGGLGLATFSSELQDNEPQVDLECWSAEPPEPDGPWEASARGQISVAGDRLALVSGISMLSSSHDLAVPPGRYDIAVWCRGREQARAGELAAIEAETLVRGVEKWLIRLWPAAENWPG
jgi:hypothetical protein